MALLTSAEAQSLWDSRAKSCKCYSTQTKDSNTFISYLFISELDEVLYHINSEDDGVSITHSTSDSNVQTNVKAYLETLEKVVPPSPSDTII